MISGFDQIERFCKKAGVTLEQGCRKIKIDTFAGAINNTIVLSGRLRGNWQATTGEPAVGVIDVPKGVDPERSKATALSLVESKTGAFTVDYLTNNLPYAKWIENRDGIMRRAVQTVTSNLKKYVGR